MACSSTPSQARSGEGCPDGALCGEAGVPLDAAVGSAQPTPDVFVSASVGPGVDGGSSCGFESDELFLQIGAATIPQPVTFTSAELQSGSASVPLSCKVDPSGGGGFTIQLSAEMGGSNGGSVSVAGLVTTAGGHGIQGTVTSAVNGSYTDSNCSIAFTYNGNPVPVVPPIAPGRIWGHLDCQAAMGPASSITDGAPATCDASADFMFENCE